MKECSKKPVLHDGKVVESWNPRSAVCLKQEQWQSVALTMFVLDDDHHLVTSYTWKTAQLTVG